MLRVSAAAALLTQHIRVYSLYQKEENIPKQAGRQHQEKAFSMERGRGYMQVGETLFPISSTRTKKFPGKREAIPTFAFWFVFTWTVQHVPYYFLVLYMFGLFFLVCVHCVKQLCLLIIKATPTI